MARGVTSKGVCAISPRVLLDCILGTEGMMTGLLTEQGGCLVRQAWHPCPSHPSLTDTTTRPKNETSANPQRVNQQTKNDTIQHTTTQR